MGKSRLYNSGERVDAIEAIGVAANNKYGFTKIIVIGNDGHKKDLCYN